MFKIPYGRQDINQSDIDAVVEVLKSNFLTQGPAVPNFERAISNYCGAKYAVAVSNATSALHIACLALGVGKGDIVWTSPITFVASANCALYCGAKVDFVDIDPSTYNISIECLKEKLIWAEKVGALPKVVIPVHLCGQSCDMHAIQELSRKYGFKIIEDASHALGGRYKDVSIGSCTYSDIVIFSFHPVKIITTGEGGAAVTNSPHIARTLELLRSHGITNLQHEMQGKPKNEIWNYQQISLGFNYRMTDIQAALGLSQIKRLDEFVAKRHQVAEQYKNRLAKLAIDLPWQHPDTYSAMHIYSIRIRNSRTSASQKYVYEKLHDSGVAANVHYIPVYLQPYYQSLGFKSGYCPEAELYYREAITIPIFPNLTPEMQNKVVAILEDLNW